MLVEIDEMEKDLIKTLVAAVFIKGKKQFPLSDNKTDLARKLSNTKELKGSLSYKTLLNYFVFYFQSGKEVNPSSDNIYTLLNYLGYQSEKQFQNNPPTINFKDVPFVNTETKGPEKEKDEKPTKSKKPLLITIVIAIIAIATYVFVIPEFNLLGKQKQGNDSKIDTTKIQKVVPKEEPQVEPPSRIYPLTKYDFFSSTKEPLVWYAEYQGETEFYSSKGNHPVTGEELKLVTQEIVDAYIKKYKDITRYSDAKILHNGSVNYMMSFRFRDIYRKVYERYKCDGIIRTIYDADSLKQDKFIVCHLTLTYKVFSKATKKELDIDTISVSGVGTTEPLALKKAIYEVSFE